MKTITISQHEFDRLHFHMETEGIYALIESKMSEVGLDHENANVYAHREVYIDSPLAELGVNGYVAERISLVFPPGASREERAARLAETGLNRHGPATWGHEFDWGEVQKIVIAERNPARRRSAEEFTVKPPLPEEWETRVVFPTALKLVPGMEGRVRMHVSQDKTCYMWEVRDKKDYRYAEGKALSIAAAITDATAAYKQSSLDSSSF